eukprot:m.28233 g.28233  ORF g.28233 m.28233 type:complete len:254 (+) comp8786_c0_seq1:868-1629(+)
MAASSRRFPTQHQGQMVSDTMLMTSFARDAAMAREMENDRELDREAEPFCGFYSICSLITAMDLSESVVQGLGVAAGLKQAAFAALVTEAVNAACSASAPDPASLFADPALSAVNVAEAKLAFGALVTTVVEATKANADAATLGPVLEDCRLSAAQIETFTSSFASKKPEIRASLRKTAFGLPHVVDVDWRLNYYIKNNVLEKMDQPRFLINLRTEAADNKADKVQFSCDMAQLQDLVAKLKEATKSLELVSS